MMTPAKGQENLSEMYYRGAEYKNGKFLLCENECVVFDTYFNSFGHGSYSTHTVAETIVFSIKLKGEVQIDVVRAEANANDSTSVKEEILQSKIVHLKEQGEVAITQSLADVHKKGIIYLSIRSIGAASEIYDFSISAKESEVRAIAMCVVICTYKREDYVRRNVACIKEHNASVAEADKIGIIVVDNGRSLGEIAGAIVIENANTGGSGGFTRGMIVASEAGYTHHLLMDDDIVFDCETLERTKRFMAHAKDAENITLGASMLVMESGYEQYEKGAVWHGRGMQTPERGYDLRTREAVIVNDNAISQKNYTAWWYCCMSTNITRRIGKPQPFFIKGDDIEYGLRAQNTVIVNNGIGVWHESFASKYNSVLSYYIRRNELILNCLHLGERSVFAVIKDIVQTAGKQVVFHRYNTLQLVQMAVEDFMKGATHFLQIDPEQKHKDLQKLSEKMYSKYELKTLGYDVDNVDYYNNNTSIIKSAITLNGYLIPRFLYPKDDKWRKVSASTAPIESMYKARTVVHYNEQAEQGFITKLKKTELIKCGFWLAVTSLKLLFKYGRLKKDYNKQLLQNSAQLKD